MKELPEEFKQRLAVAVARFMKDHPDIPYDDVLSLVLDIVGILTDLSKVAAEDAIITFFGRIGESG